jgi:hypothetical protein
VRRRRMQMTRRRVLLEAGGLCSGAKAHPFLAG